MIDVRALTHSEFFGDPNLEALIDAYRKECANKAFGDVPPPDVEQYRRLYELGQLVVLGAYDGEKLVGFVLLLVTAVPHYAGMPLVVVESIFCDPGYRHKGVGRALLTHAREVAFSRKAAGVYVTAPAGSRFERLLQLTARHTNTTFFLPAKEEA